MESERLYTKKEVQNIIERRTFGLQIVIYGLGAFFLLAYIIGFTVVLPDICTCKNVTDMRVDMHDMYTCKLCEDTAMYYCKRCQIEYQG